MGRVPIYKRPSFLALALAIVGVAVYFYSLLSGTSLTIVATAVLIDVFVCFILFHIWLFFFAQFVLPVRGIRQRFSVYRRVILRRRGSRASAIFLQNGRVVARGAERKRPELGVAWLDSASAAVLRSQTEPDRVIGPGIHFTKAGERIASVFSLHTQICTLGPSPEDDVFELPREGASDEEKASYRALEAKRTTVSARTRDGNEVIPRIRVVFRLDAAPASPGEPGSRFGFSMEAVQKAALGPGISAEASGESRSASVAWNELPGLIAADLWREFLGKFTLDELFAREFAAPPEIMQPERAPNVVLEPSPQMLRRNLPARLLRQVNHRLEGWLTARGIEDQAMTPGLPKRRPAASAARSAGPLTALEIIGQMMKRRMTQAQVPTLDDCGRTMKGHGASEEFRRLSERGLRVLDVKVLSVQFDPAIEQQLVRNWSSEWMQNAESARRQTEQLELLAAQAGRKKALLEHTWFLAQALNAERPETIGAAVRCLLQASQNEILTDRGLFGRAESELARLSEMLKWTETSGHE